MAELVRVCGVEELANGASRVVEVAGRPVAVFRQGDSYFAIDDVCPHMGASLSDGYVEDGIVTCPWHAWRFRLSDGLWADSPRLKIGCYKVHVVEGEVRVEAPAQNG
jgi:nitrite reductase (NADH) small subunit/3-phenylpropionate/trans-cinnamate dioxygenase ferredoxin subunit